MCNIACMNEKSSAKEKVSAGPDKFKDKSLEDVFKILDWDHDVIRLITEKIDAYSTIDNRRNNQRKITGEKNIRINIIAIAGAMGDREWSLGDDEKFLEACMQQPTIGNDFANWKKQYEKIIIDPTDRGYFLLAQFVLMSVENNEGKMAYSMTKAEKGLRDLREIAKKLQEAGIKPLIGFEEILSTIGKKMNENAMAWINRLIKIAPGVRDTQAIQSYLWKIDALGFPEGKQLDCCKILAGYHIQLEDLSMETLKQMAGEIYVILENADPQLTDQLPKVKNPDNVPDIFPTAQRAFSNEKQSKELSTLLNALTKRNESTRENLGGQLILARESNFRIFGFLRDPAIESIIAVIPFIAKKAFEKDPDLPVMIGRNLRRKSIGVNQKSVDREREQIVNERVRLKDIQMLGPSRGVTLIAHNEKMYKNKETEQLMPELDLRWHLNSGKTTLGEWEPVERFGKTTLQERIRATGSKLSVVKPIGNQLVEGKKNEEALTQDLKKKKEEILLAIENTKPPHTFIFDGHGGENAFWINGGFIGQEFAETKDDPSALHYENFATALRKRHEKFKDVPASLEKDIFYFQSCFSTNLTFHIDHALHGTDYRPIIMTAAEYGQHGFSDFNSETGSKYTERVLGLDEKNKKAVTLGDIIERQSKGDTDTSIFIPRKDSDEEETILRQISQNDQQKSEQKRV